MLKNKKGQLLILSGLFMILILIFSYSVETDNTYIVKNSKYNLLENIMHETCKVGMLSNGTYIATRYASYESLVENYCISVGAICNLTITNNTIIPTNNSLVNYTLYDYEISYEQSGFKHETSFNCP